MSPSSAVWREAPSTCLWETAVRLLLGHRTDDDGGYEILLVLKTYSNGDLSNRSLHYRRGAHLLRFGDQGPSILVDFIRSTLYVKAYKLDLVA